MRHASSFSKSHKRLLTRFRTKLGRVTVRMVASPVPRAPDDRLERGKLRLPMQIAFDTARARHQHGRITGTAGDFAYGNRMPGYAANGFDHFANAIAAAGAEIVNELVTLAQSLEHKNMRAGEVAHMNVITDAGAIGCGIVGSEDRNVFALSERNLQRKRNQMRLRHMVLAKIAGGSRGVKIAEARIPQAVDTVKPGEHLLD